MCIRDRQPGGTWVDADRGIQVEFPTFVGSAPDAACRVNIQYAAAGAKPDPMFLTVGAGTVDLWMDNMQNGTGVYPSTQPLDGDGVPTGPGDPFAPGKVNLLNFRVRNLGAAPTPSLAVRLIAEQPPHVTCGVNPPRILDKIRLVDPIAPGGVALDGVNLEIPDNRLVRVRAEILSVPGETTTSNNKGERTFTTGANSAVLDQQYAGPVTINATFINGCPGDQLATAVPMTMPVKTGPPIPDPIFDRWRVTDPGLTLVGPGEQAQLAFTFLPPSPVTPGSGVTIPISFRAGGGLAAAGGMFGESRPQIDSMEVTIPVVEQAT